MTAINPTTEILLKRSTTSGSAGNTVAGTTADALGKYVSTTQVLASLHDLFPALTGTQNAANRTDYACFFVHNTNGANAWTTVKAWLSSQVSGGTALEIGVDPTAASAVGSATPQAVTAASATTAPAGVTFLGGTAIDTEAEGLDLGDIPSGFVKAIWVKRIASNSGAVNADGGVVSLAGDTGAA